MNKTQLRVQQGAKTAERIMAYKKQHPTMTNAAIGRIFNLSRERVRRIIKAQLEKWAEEAEG